MLKILYVGHRESTGQLNNAGFTKSNATGNAQLLNNQTLIPYQDVNGILGGSIAAIVGDEIVGPAGAAGPTDNVVGVYMNNAAGNPFENSPTAASGIGTYVSGMGVFEVDIFETQDVSGNPIMLPQAGEKLFSSQNGLLTSVRGLSGGAAATGSTIIGIVLSAPSSASLTMRFKLLV